MKARVRETAVQKAAKSEFEKYAVGYANHCKDAVQVYFYSKETAQKVCDLLNREENDNEQK